MENTILRNAENLPSMVGLVVMSQHNVHVLQSATNPTNDTEKGVPLLCSLYFVAWFFYAFYLESCKPPIRM